MSCITINILELKDYLILIIGFLFSISWTIILYRLKPNLQILSVDKVKNELKIKIINKGCFFAVNLKIEACAVSQDYTYHFNVDKQEFLILPPKKIKKDSSHYRIFKIDSLSDSAIKYSDYNTIFNNLTKPNSQSVLRVRLHASHEYSGFGKAFEQKLRWTDNKFKKIS